MQLNIPPDLEALVQKRLATGAFASAEEVLRRALEVFDAEETWSDEERQALDAKIGRALEQFERGEGIPGDAARARLQQRKENWLKEHPTARP